MVTVLAGALERHVPNRLTMVDAEDIYLRFPSDSRSFEEQDESCMPIFDPYESNLSKAVEKTSDVRSYYVELVHLWSTCQTTIYRSAHRASSSGLAIEMMQRLITRLETWLTSLPARLTFGESNLESALLREMP